MTRYLPELSYKTRKLFCWLRLSLEGDSLGDLQHVLVGEGSLGVGVVAALALHPPHQVPHVRREAVLGGGPRQANTPADQITLSVCSRNISVLNPISEGGGHIVPPPTKYRFKSGYLGARTPQTH